MIDLDNIDFSSHTILVVGDFILDNYVGGDVERISPEAPVPVLKANWGKIQLGGAGNVVNNIHSLNGKTRVLTCIGDDEASEEMCQLLSGIGADIDYLVKDNSVMTTKKTRIVAKNQQVVRIDYEKIGQIPDCFYEYVRDNENTIFRSVDAIIISDYGKGLLRKDFTQFVIKKGKEMGIPVLVDPKGNDWSKYYGATICTPNLSELSGVCNKKLSNEDEEGILENGLRLCHDIGLDYLLVTRSEKGMALIEANGKKENYPANKKEVIDVSGAGDTVISVMALCMVSKKSMSDCCRISNIAASIVVSKFGTSTVSLDELRNESVSKINDKRVKSEELQKLCEKIHVQGRKIVFTNGCFDLMHAGHVFSFEQAHLYGDVLIVGINSDQSVKRIKGPKRPIICEEDRAHMVQSLSVVDYVVLFDEDTPLELIKKINPDVLVKGSDYNDKEVVGREYVEERGGTVKLIKLKQGLSTSNIIEKIVHNYL